MLIGFEPMSRLLQSRALLLGHSIVFGRYDPKMPEGLTLCGKALRQIHPTLAPSGSHRSTTRHTGSAASGLVCVWFHDPIVKKILRSCIPEDKLYE